MKTTLTSITALVIILSAHISFSQQIGDPGWIFDGSKYDSRFPAMIELSKAGVEGGIPYREDTPIKETVAVIEGDQDMADNIQAAIDATETAGGGVVLLSKGTYPIIGQIVMKSNVILRGEHKDSVLLEVFTKFKGASSAVKVEVISMENLENAGLEDFSMIYNADYEGEEMFPLDKDWAFDLSLIFELRNQNVINERVYHDRENFLFHDNDSLYVDFVHIDGSSKNCWIDNCNLRNAASNLIRISNPSKHITIRNSLVQGSFQKGVNGNGYGINCSGTYVLMTKNIVKNVRHWAIQQGAEYNVVYDNVSETDMNFHQGDLGKNLIENNIIHIPHWHLWVVFQTGASYHKDPGLENMFFNNDCIERSKGALYTDDQVYTFDGRDVVPLSTTPPTGGTFYALKRGVASPPSIEFTQPANNIRINEGSSLVVKANTTDDDGVFFVELYVNGELVSRDEEAPYEWGFTGEDPLLREMSAGNYVLKLVTQDLTGLKAEKSINVLVGASTVQNLSIGKSATASSEPEAENQASGAIDGTTDTRWSAPDFPQWLEVDLGEIKSINKTELVTFQDRAYHFIVESKVAVDGAYAQIVDRSANATPGKVDTPITDTFDPVDARFVKLTITGAAVYTGVWSSILEFRVFGALDETVAPTKEDTTIFPPVIVIPEDTIPEDSIPDIVLSVDVERNASGFYVYPNPFESTLNIRLLGDAQHKEYQISLLSLNGKIVLDKRVIDAKGGELKLDLSQENLQPGLYLLKISDGANIYTLKVSK